MNKTIDDACELSRKQKVNKAIISPIQLLTKDQKLQVERGDNFSEDFISQFTQHIAHIERIKIQKQPRCMSTTTVTEETENADITVRIKTLNI